MATKAIKPLRLDKCVAGGSVEFDKCSTSGTFVTGTPMIKANGAYTACADMPTQVTALAMSAGTDYIPGDTSGVINLHKIRPGDLYEISAFHSTAASAVVADSALDANAKYAILQATVSSSGGWCIDLSDTTNVSVKLVERIDSATDLYPRCRVSFLDTVCAPYGV